MERLTKEDFKLLVQDGIATDIFIAERAFTLFDIIGKSDRVFESVYHDFLYSAQGAFKDQFLLALARIFDRPSHTNKTRCMKGVLDMMSNNSNILPKIIDRIDLGVLMKDLNFNDEIIELTSNEGSDNEIALKIVDHFNQLLKEKEVIRLLTTLKNLRDKRLAHNDLTISHLTELTERIDIVTYQDLYKLLEMAKNFIGVIGWAYMSTVFMISGEYVLTEDARRPSYSLRQLINMK